MFHSKIVIVLWVTIKALTSLCILDAQTDQDLLCPAARRRTLTFHRKEDYGYNIQTVQLSSRSYHVVPYHVTRVGVLWELSFLRKLRLAHKFLYSWNVQLLNTDDDNCSMVHIWDLYA